MPSSKPKKGIDDLATLFPAVAAQADFVELGKNEKCHIAPERRAVLRGTPQANQAVGHLAQREHLPKENLRYILCKTVQSPVSIIHNK